MTQGNPRPIAELRRLFDYPKSSQPLDPREYEVGIPSVLYQQIPYEFELASVLGLGSFQIAVNVSAVNPETRAWEMVGNVTVHDTYYQPNIIFKVLFLPSDSDASRSGSIEVISAIVTAPDRFYVERRFCRNIGSEITDPGNYTWLDWIAVAAYAAHANHRRTTAVQEICANWTNGKDYCDYFMKNATRETKAPTPIAPS